MNTGKSFEKFILKHSNRFVFITDKIFGHAKPVLPVRKNTK